MHTVFKTVVCPVIVGLLHQYKPGIYYILRPPFIIFNAHHSLFNWQNPKKEKRKREVKQLSN